VKSIETGEVFECDPAWLQQDPEIFEKEISGHYALLETHWGETIIYL